MIEEYGWSIVISVYLVYTLGIGALLFAIIFVWSRAIDLIFPLFHFHKEFIVWNYEKYKPKVFTPKIKQMPHTKFDDDEDKSR